jgi:poly(3-hydroxybutyrate) depolymerase
MTVEGERDDISGVGQTKAAHTLCTGLKDEQRVHWLQERVGHYGVFNGSRFRSEIAPRIHDFMLSNEPRAAQKAAPATRPAESEGVSSGAALDAVAPLVEEPKKAPEPPAPTPKLARAKPAAARRAPAVKAPPDDLTKIVGVGPKLQAVLNDAGIFRFAQIAGLSHDEVASLNAKIVPPGRMSREKWQEQAARLAKAE